MASNDNIKIGTSPDFALDAFLSFPIEAMSLSARSHNALRRAGIHTIDTLLSLDRDQLLKIKNLGKKSIEEIEKLQSEIVNDPHLLASKIACLANENGEEEEEPSFFYDETGRRCKDVPISGLSLSYRSERLLNEAGYRYASELLNVTKRDLLQIQSMGGGSVNEILYKIARIVFEKVEPVSEQEELARDNCMDFISLFTTHFPTNHMELLPVLMPYFMEAQKPEAMCGLHEEPVLLRQVKKRLISVLEINCFGISRESMRSLFPTSILPDNAMSKALGEMSAKGLIRIGQYIELVRPKLWEYVDSIENDRQREILEMRLRGRTLEEIGEMQGVTRERVRQIILRCIRNKNAKGVVVEEDRCQKIYETYAFSKDDFMMAFDVDEYVYNYLTIVCEKAGERPALQFLGDEDYPGYVRKAAERAVYKNYFNIGGVRVYKKRTDLADYVSQAYFKDEGTYDEFVRVYYSVVQSLGLSGDSSYVLNERSYQNRLADSRNILWKYQGRFRYYDMAMRDFSALLEGMNFEQYSDVEYSTLKFFRSHPELMEEYDIRDEYELHNLLKKLNANNSIANITISRMPIIAFGNANRDRQVLDLLLHLAPIDASGFCEAYEAVYGVLARTVAGSFLSCIDKYRDHNGIYDIHPRSYCTKE